MNARRPLSDDSTEGQNTGVRFDIESVKTVGDTHVGRVRRVNQDEYGEWSHPRTGQKVIFVADGMGGHRGGEVASQLAVEEVGAAFLAEPDEAPQEILSRAFERANRTIFERARREASLSGMGTTGVALLLTENRRAWVAHVGDSRLYRLRRGEMELLTSDHSVVGELVRRGQISLEEARVHPQSNEILRAIGTRLNLQVDLREIDVQPNDRFLLCSDGLTSMLPDPEVEEVLRSKNIEVAVPELIELANEAGGSDNITLVVAEIPSASASADQTVGPGPEPAASGSGIRWLVLLALIGGLLLLFLGGGDPGRP
ncbi:MAG: hypothetical protein CBC48_03100 [bacterium TMED88]|nr:hypothetical protein [Deltaproteobacteria bacterium]OUV35916.1 MAG: hypothetical protein CBC48_03100 [bacterium TMED88]